MKLFSEAIKLKDGIYYNIQYHQERIDRTLRHFGLSSFNLYEVLSAQAAPPYGLYKCRVEYGGSMRNGKDCPIYIKVEFIEYTIPSPKQVKLVEDNEIVYSYKSINRKRLNLLKESSQCDEIIIIKNNKVTDSSAANLVFEHDGRFFTPNSYLLPGTKRQFLLDTNKITECTISLDDILFYDRAYVISSMIDIEDEVCVDTRDLLPIR